MVQFTVNTRAKSSMEDITAQVAQVVERSGVQSGLCHIFVPHTTAGVTINDFRFVGSAAAKRLEWESEVSPWTR